MTAAKTKEAPRPPRWTDYMPVDDIPSATRNPKKHDEAAIGKSISKWGFADGPILDERTGRLVAGHGRLADVKARRDAGGDPPDGVLVDDDGRWLMPVQRGWASRSDEDAEGFLVAHNHTTEKGGWDSTELAALLADLAETDADLLDATGYTMDEIATLEGFDDPTGGDDDDPADAEVENLMVAYGVVVEVDTEEQQTDLLQRLMAEGFNVRALM